MRERIGFLVRAFLSNDIPGDDRFSANLVTGYVLPKAASIIGHGYIKAPRVVAAAGLKRPHVERGSNIQCL